MDQEGWIISKSNTHCDATLWKMLRKLQSTSTPSTIVQDEGMGDYGSHTNNSSGYGLNLILHLCCHSQVYCQKTEGIDRLVEAHYPVRYIYPTINRLVYLTATNIP